MFFWLFLTSLISLLVGAALMRRFGMTHTRMIYENVSADGGPTCFRCTNTRSLFCDRCAIDLSTSERAKDQCQACYYGVRHEHVAPASVTNALRPDDATEVDWSARPAPASVVETPTTLKENA
jgi:hypothetical protein